MPRSNVIEGVEGVVRRNIGGEDVMLYRAATIPADYRAKHLCELKTS
jgi:hypothetical protein